MMMMKRKNISCLPKQKEQLCSGVIFKYFLAEWQRHLATRTDCSVAATLNDNPVGEGLTWVLKAAILRDSCILKSPGELSNPSIPGPQPQSNWIGISGGRVQVLVSFRTLAADFNMYTGLTTNRMHKWEVQQWLLLLKLHPVLKCFFFCSSEAQRGEVTKFNTRVSA